MQIRSLRPRAIAAIWYLVFVTSIAQAAIVENIGQRASTDFPNRTATYATNGAGLIDNAHSDVPSRTMWLSADGDIAGAFEIDLGAVYAVNSIRFWNYNEFVPGRPDLLDRGVASANIDLGLTPSSYVTQIPAKAFLQAPGTVTDFSETFNVGGIPARFIRLDILSNFGNPQYTGFSEIQIDGTLLSGPRPLPATVFSVSSTIADPFDRRAEHMINRGGLFSQTHSITPDGNMWLGGFGDLAPVITFDLGSSQPLDRMLFWNYNEFLLGRTDLLTRGVSQADILLSNDGFNFTPFATDVSFAMAPGDNMTEFAQSINFGGATARYVQIAVDANHGNVEYTGISEVQFFAVPEPSAAVLTAVSLAGLLLRRKRNAGAGRTT